MILVDMSQVTISNVMVHLNRSATVDIDMCRHMILNSLRMYNQKFKREYGDMILCYDSGNTWRRDYFPNYKAGRRKSRASSTTIDWSSVYGALDQIKQELKDNFPYKVLQVQKAEADDIIGSLVNKYNTEKILIISGDKDFKQLQKYKNVQQYSPVAKKMITCDDPSSYIHEHIIKGDSTDGIPNFLSADNCLVDGIRQTPISKRKVESWLQLQPEQYCNEDMLRNYQRNQTLIDLQYVPNHIQDECVDMYVQSKPANKSKLLNYFIKNKLKKLIENISEF